MNLTQLKYFRAVCLYQTVSAAANYLHISQPSLSNAIKELEEEFNVLLFHRQHRGMVLTPAGEILQRLSEELLKQAENLEKTMCDLGRERKVLHLGVPPMIGSVVIPGLYRDFVSAHPEVKLDIKESGSQELMAGLQNESLDMIFMPHNRPLAAGISSFTVAKLEIVCCVAKHNPLANKTVVSLQELKEVPLVLFQNSFYQTEEIKRRFLEVGIQPEILLQTEQFSTILSLISENVAAGFMFRHLTESHPEMVAVPLENPLFVEVSLAWREKAFSFHTMGLFKEFIQQYNMFSSAHH